MQQKADVKPRSAQFEARRRRIIVTAAKMFNDRGYESTSLDEIAERLKLHKATLYHYIENKEEILYQCLEITMADLHEALAFVQDTREPALEKLRRFFTALIHVQLTDMGKCLCLVGPKPLGKKANQKIRQKQRQLDAAIRGIFEQGVADGSIASCEPKLATALMFGAFNWIARWYKPSKQSSPQQIAEAFLNLVIEGARPR